MVCGNAPMPGDPDLTCQRQWTWREMGSKVGCSCEPDEPFPCQRAGAEQRLAEYPPYSSNLRGCAWDRRRLGWPWKG
jgi:hypothetical protein